MAISKEADRNHEALFPNRKSTLKVTDPEFVELFDTREISQSAMTEGCS